MSAPTGTEWTDADIDTLHLLWDVEGLSAAAIGVRMGRSRSAVLGKVRRLYFTRRGRGKTPHPKLVDRLTSAQAKALVRRFQVDDSRSVAARMFGDPPPGRSALDKLLMKERSKNVLAVRKSTELLAPSEREVLMGDHLNSGRVV